ncbi:MAG TPA: transcription termination/antitermination NusG family protein [Opitutaceae bacterium]|nr:transcription termination/antitermination NusG family protein [Opitutaceae bacterium]
MTPSVPEPAAGPATPAPAEAAPAEAAPAEAAWFVCHTKPRCEKKFAALLVREACRHSLPLVASERRYGTRLRRFTKPLFPGYVFAQVEPPRRNRLYQQDLLVRFLPVSDEAAFLVQLAAVEALVASGLEATLHPLLKHGARVRIVGGPLKGVEGMIEDPRSPKGVIIAMDVLQQGVRVAVPLADLKLLP